MPMWPKMKQTLRNRALCQLSPPWPLFPPPWPLFSPSWPFKPCPVGRSGDPDVRECWRVLDGIVRRLERGGRAPAGVGGGGGRRSDPDHEIRAVLRSIIRRVRPVEGLVSTAACTVHACRPLTQMHAVP